jgi:general stress protein 26
MTAPVLVQPEHLERSAARCRLSTFAHGAWGTPARQPDVPFARVRAADLLRFMREHPLAVEASVSAAGAAQAAVVGVVVTDDFELFFDTAETSRKVQNIRRNPMIALVIGGTTPGDERTVQYEGVADEPRGAELQRLKELYFESFPDGRERQDWPGNTYIRARPIWVRYTDFNQDPPASIEFDPATLGAAT